MINKHLSRALVFVGLFAVASGTTIAISHEVNKKREPESPTEPVKSDTEQFISNLASFGNLEGNINLSGSVKDVDLSAKGDVFVSLETLDTLAVKADLDIEIFSSTYNVTLTYIDNTLFFDYDFLHIKAKKDDFSLIIEALKNIGIEFEIPEVFKNLNPAKLLYRFSSMKSQNEGDKIVYTCNLIDNVSPIIFTSNMKYQMTGLSIQNLKADPIVASLDATTNVLGKGHNKVTNPEKGGQEYIDISEYLGE